ncbi:MAG: hypothetical protein PHR04_05280 [Syntrophomonadaceae bacterium]|nr:hypothetical protein [Syntrophomonadaceae bacterium]MDD4562730.1 hypothetical protein [Syntrophomonadaceae bacterium]
MSASYSPLLCLTCQDILPDKATYIDLANKYWHWEIERSKKRQSARTEG